MDDPFNGWDPEFARAISADTERDYADAMAKRVARARLADRLSADTHDCPFGTHCYCFDTDEQEQIAALSAENERLREALEVIDASEALSPNNRKLLRAALKESPNDER